MKQEEDFFCEPGYSVNASANDDSEACEAPFFKLGITPEQFHQYDQCEVGDPCFPGSGGSLVHEAGFTYGAIGFELHYNSLRQLRPYAFIDKNWSHSFANRVLTETLTSNHTHTGGTTMYVQDGEAHIETYTRVTTGIYKSRNSVGRVLRRGPQFGGEWNLYSTAGRVEVYDAAGRILRVVELDTPAKSLQIGYVEEIDTSDEMYWRVARVTDGVGRSVEFHYSADVHARLDRITSDSGRDLIVFGYDEIGRLHTTTRAGASRRYLYNEPEHVGADLPYHLTGILDEQLQRYSTFEFDDWGRATASWHGSGAEKVTLTYDDDATVGVVMPDGDLRVYSYTSGQPFRKPDQVNEGEGTRSFLYDSEHRVRRSTDRRGYVSEYLYGDGIHETVRVDALGTQEERRKETDWNASWNRPSAVRTYGRAPSGGGRILLAEQRYTYNQRGQLSTSSEHDPITGTARVVTYRYCEPLDVQGGGCPIVGLLESVDGPRTDVEDATTYAYRTSTMLGGCASGTDPCYRRGDLWKTTNPVGHVAEITRYDSGGRIATTRDANGATTRYEHNLRGWLTKQSLEIGSGSEDTVYSYLSNGVLTRVTFPGASHLRFITDAAHRVTAVVNNLNERVDFALDDAGNRTLEQTKDTSGRVLRALSRVYDGFGRLESVRDASGRAYSIEYDPAGNVEKETSRRGVVSLHTHDGLGRLRDSIDDLAGIGATTAREYDAEGRLTAVVDPNGLRTEYSYNGFGDLEVQISPDTGTTRFTYDIAGNTLTRTDARNVVATYSYDRANRVTHIGFGASGGDINYIYDVAPAFCPGSYSKGRLSSVTDSSGRTNYCYDHRGNVTLRRETIGDELLQTTWSYDAHGRLATLGYPTGRVVKYSYDQLGRVASVQHRAPGETTWKPLVTSISYLPFGPITQIGFADGSTLTRTYNSDYRIDSIDASHPGGLNLKYWLDADGNVTELGESATGGPLEEYTYDGLGRLFAVTGADGTPIASYGYDPTGNRVSKRVGLGFPESYSYVPSTHRLASVAGASRSYDASGNTTLIGGRKLSYDSRGRLDSATDGWAVWSYQHNFRGERVRKTGTNPLVQIAPALYSYSMQGMLLHEVDGFPASDDPCVCEPNKGEECLDVVPPECEVDGGISSIGSSKSGEVVAPGVGGGSRSTVDYVYIEGLLIAVASSSSGLHYIHTDHLGTPRVAISTTAGSVSWEWPVRKNAFGDQRPVSSGLTLNVRFPGQYYDVETNLHYNYFRNYEPTTGRYIESDPIGLRGGIATYPYVKSDPLGGIDPSGLFTMEWVECILQQGIAGIDLGCGKGLVRTGVAGADRALERSCEVVQQGIRCTTKCAIGSFIGESVADVIFNAHKEAMIRALENTAKDVATRTARKFVPVVGQLDTLSGAVGTIRCTTTCELQ